MKKTISLILVLALGLASVSLATEGIWTTKSPMPTARWELSTSVVDGRIYVIGGSPSYPFSAVFTMEVYEPATDSWTQKGDVPCASSTSFASVVDGKIYAFGGYVCRRSYEYDPVTDTWTQKADMPTYRVALSGSTLDGKIYAIGGQKPRVWPPWKPMTRRRILGQQNPTCRRQGGFLAPAWWMGRSMPSGV